MIRFFLVFLLAGFGAGLGYRALAANRTPAAPASEPEPAAASAGLLLDLGNSLCPVMDGEIDGKTWFEWKGLRVGFCCPGCDKRFLSDPEKALDKTGVSWRDARAAVQRYEDAPAAHKAHVLADIKQAWKVVRE